jgi:hypothetical protein
MMPSAPARLPDAPTHSRLPERPALIPKVPVKVIKRALAALHLALGISSLLHNCALPRQVRAKITGSVQEVTQLVHQILFLMVPSVDHPEVRARLTVLVSETTQRALRHSNLSKRSASFPRDHVNVMPLARVSTRLVLPPSMTRRLSAPPVVESAKMTGTVLGPLRNATLISGMRQQFVLREHRLAKLRLSIALVRFH